MGLKPVTVLNARAILQKQREEDDDGGPSQYRIHTASTPVAERIKASSPVVLVKKSLQQTRWTYQKLFLRLGQFLRWVDDTAYGISILFLILAVVGIIMDRHSYTIMGLSGIVLLSLLRVWTAVSNLVTIIFKKGPIKGLIFLIPPVTLYTIYNNWPKWQKPIKRIINPALVICGVIGVYMFVPWVNGNKKFSGNLKSQIEGAMEAVKRDASSSMSTVTQEVDKMKGDLPKKLDNLHLDDITKKAKEKLSDVSENVSKQVKSTVSDVSNKLKEKEAGDEKTSSEKPAPK